MRFISGGAKFLSSLASQACSCSSSSSRLSPALVSLCSSGIAPVSSSPEECSWDLVLPDGCSANPLWTQLWCQQLLHLLFFGGVDDKWWCRTRFVWQIAGATFNGVQPTVHAQCKLEQPFGGASLSDHRTSPGPSLDVPWWCMYAAQSWQISASMPHVVYICLCVN